jgi:cyclic pyranopterin phosphate synthase
MVDVSDKPATRRVAEARCLVHTTADVDDLLRHPPDGVDLLTMSRLAGIAAGKQTSLLIPLCHPLRLDTIDLDIAPLQDGFRVATTVGVVEKTGVEMEALTACAVAALGLIHALRHADPRATVGELTLWHKSGGRSGTWQRDPNGDLPSTRVNEELRITSQQPRSGASRGRTEKLSTGTYKDE